jgi:hypothetical protein
MARRSSPVTSAAASIAAPSLPGYPASPSMAPVKPVLRCWPRWMSTHESRCESCGTARSRSRWRSIPKLRPMRPGMRWPLVQVVRLCRSHQADAGRRGCCTFLLLPAAASSKRSCEPVAELADTTTVITERVITARPSRPDARTTTPPSRLDTCCVACWTAPTCPRTLRRAPYAMLWPGWKPTTPLPRPGTG